MAARDSRVRAFATCVAAGRSIVDAAREVGISERTGHRLMKKPKFSAQVRRIQAAARKRVVGRLTDASTAAVATLLELLDSGHPATARLGAARTILEHTSRLTETVELEHRIAALEDDKESAHAQESSTANRAT